MVLSLRSLGSLLLAGVGWLPIRARTSEDVATGEVVHGADFVPDFILRVSVAWVESSCEGRQNIVINGTSPGPAIYLRPGSSPWIRVYNDIPDQNLTMHWHGIAQRLAPFADGAAMISQWPIPPGHYFDYQIALEPDDAGTYFYHSHVEMQALSASGPLIVDDCASLPYHYDDERIFHFMDHFSKSDEEIVEDLTSSPYNFPGESKGVLLNGKGIAVGYTPSPGPPGGPNGFFGLRVGNHPGNAVKKRCDGSGEGWESDACVAPSEPEPVEFQPGMDQIEQTSDCTLPVIDVEPGKMYRFRFIGATGLSYIAIAFEGHETLSIIQTDGTEYNEPVVTDHIQLAAGQRFDVLFKTKSLEELQKEGRNFYYIQYETLHRSDTYRGYAVLRYDYDAEVPTPPAAPIRAFSAAEVTSWGEYSFRPLYPERNQAPSADEVTRRLIITCEEKEDFKTGRVIWELNRLSWTEERRQIPVLVDIYNRGQDAIPNYEVALRNYGWDPVTKLFPAKVGEVIEIIWQNTGSQFFTIAGLVESHPFHAHGQHYYDIGAGPGYYDPEVNNKKLEETGFRSVKRDTTMLFRYQDKVKPGQAAGWRGWRIRIDHPGVWMLHCHILTHMMMGMNTVWVVGDADDILTIPLSISQHYLKYGGDVYGNITHAPVVYHFFNQTSKCIE